MIARVSLRSEIVGGVVLSSLLLLGVVSLLGGCSSPETRSTRRSAAARRASMEPPTVADADSSEGEAQPAEDPAVAPADEPQAEEAPERAPSRKLAGGPGAAAEEPAEAPEPAAGEPPARRGAAGSAAPGRKKMTPAELIRVMGLDRESREREAAELVKQARTDRINLDAQRAEERLEQAHSLDPSNEEAKRLLDETRTLLGDKRGLIPQVAENLSSERRVAIMQAKAEVRNAINSGDRHTEQKEFDQAMADYEKAIQLVRSFPFNLQLDEELATAQKRLIGAQESKKKQEEEDRLALEKRMKETRETELKSSVNLLQNRVRELRRKAKDAWEREQYAQVESISTEILSLLPDDEEAATLQREARDERHLQTRQKIQVAMVENHARVLLGLDESAVTYQRIFRYPSGREWQKLQPKIVTLEEKVSAKESSVEKEIKRKMEDLQTIGFAEKTPFLEALKVLSSISGINFIMTKESLQAVRDEDIKVQLPQMRDSPLRSIVNLVLASAGEKNFQYTIDNGAVVIGSKEDLKDKLKTYIEFYDIKDVTQAHPDYPAPKLALAELQGQQKQQGGGIDVGGPTDEEDHGAVFEVQKLIELLSKELKDANGELVGAEPKVQNGKLMIKTTLENHQKVQRLLDQLRKTTGIMVTVESRFLDIQENFLEEIGVDLGNPSNTFLPNSIPDIDGAGTSIDPGYEFTNTEQDYNLRAATLGQFSQTLGSKVNPFNISSAGGAAYQINLFDAERFQLEAILTGVGKEQSIRKLNSPRVTAFNTQVSHTLVINQAAYIQDLEVNQTGVIPVINPVIGVLNSGSILEVRPTVSYDRKYVVLEIQPTLAEKLQSERALLNLSGNFTVVPVELPVLSVTKIKTTVTIPDGGTVLVGGLRRELHTDESLGVPLVRRIPLLNLLFGRKGESTLRSNVFVLINAKITVIQEEEERLFNT
jgi:general secretion pathway protein D